MVLLYFDFLMVLWFASTGEHPKAIRWLLFVIVEVLIYSIRLTNFSDILDFHNYLLIGVGLNET